MCKHNIIINERLFISDEKLIVTDTLKKYERAYKTNRHYDLFASKLNLLLTTCLHFVYICLT